MSRLKYYNNETGKWEYADSAFSSGNAEITIPEWAKQPEKPTYTADEVGAQIADFVVNMVSDGTEDNLIPDKTWKEAETAYESGARLVCMYDGMEYTLVAFYKGEEAHFCHNSITELKERRIYFLYNSKAYMSVMPAYSYAFPVQSVNDKTGAVQLTAKDVGALPDTTKIPTVPTKVSAFTNDSGYQTAEQVTNAINTALGVIENGTY